MNRARCLICNTLLHSKSRHDGQHCSCGNLFLDGGDDYRHIGHRDVTMIALVHDDGSEVKLVDDNACASVTNGA